MNAPSKTTDFTDFDRITINPAQCGGRPCIRGMRIRVTDVLGLLAAGMTRQDILKDYDELEDADITACLGYAAAITDKRVLVVGKDAMSR